MKYTIFLCVFSDPTVGNHAVLDITRHSIRDYLGFLGQPDSAFHHGLCTLLIYVHHTEEVEEIQINMPHSRIYGA